MRKAKQVFRRLLALACALSLALALAPAAQAQQPDPFADVGQGDWFKLHVDKVVEAGLMSGLGENAAGEREFGPGSSLTVAQALVLAFQIHSQANGGTLPQAEGAWYMPYYQYCLDKGIVTSRQVPQESLTQAATRFDMVSILDKAVPESRMAPIVTLADGGVPDLREGDPYGGVVYRWYRAGIVSGSDGGYFYGDTGINRAQVAVILCQINLLLAPEQPKKEVAALGMRIAEPSLTVGDTTTATLTFTPEDAADKSVTWSSGNSAVAVVSRSGKITAVGEGTTVITATAANGVMAAGRVMVAAPEQSEKEVAALQVHIAEPSLRVGETTAATLTFTPEDAADKSVTWSSGSTAVATVSRQGMITAVGEGSTVITATAANGVKAAGTVTVAAAETAEKAVTALRMRIAEPSLVVGDITTATLTFTPNDATDKTVSWSSGDPAVAAVNQQGVITAVGAGSAVITAAAANGVQASGTVSVTAAQAPEAEEITMNLSVAQSTLTVGDAIYATLTFTPWQAGNQPVAWTSSNPAVAVVDHALIDAVGAGAAVITATAASGHQASVTITVVKAAPVLQGLSMRITDSTLAVGELTAAALTFIPGDAEDKRVTWSSSSAAVASVDQNGIITAVGPGTAVITATAANGVQAAGVMTVSPPAMTPQEMEAEVVRLVNIERAKEGLAALAVDPGAAEAAGVRAQELNELFSHTRPDGRECFTALDEAGVFYTYAGENIAMGHRTPEEVVAGWMNSPGHRANILSAGFGHIGVGYASGNCWVQLFTD